MKRIARNQVTLVMCLFAVFLLSSCSKNKVACGSEDGVQLLSEIILDEANNILSKGKKDDGSAIFDPNLVKNLMGKVIVTVENIRTTNQDQNSTKVMCAGTVKISISPDILKQADDLWKAAGSDSIDDYANARAIKRAGNDFEKTMEYNLQPTDDGKRLYANLINPKPLSEFVGQVVAGAILRPVYEKHKIEQAKEEEMERKKAEKDKADQLDSELNQAKKENIEAMGELSKIRNSSEYDENRLGDPVEWAKNKDATCKKGAESASSDPVPREIWRLNCDTDTIKLRVSDLYAHLR